MKRLLGNIYILLIYTLLTTQSEISSGYWSPLEASKWWKGQR